MLEEMAPLNKTRRPSLRYSASSTSSSGLALESPRTPLLQDSGAVHFNPIHFLVWEVPQELWLDLPAVVRVPLVEIQQVGAAVQTSFDRLADLKERLPDGHLKETIAPSHKNGLVDEVEGLIAERLRDFGLGGGFVKIDHGDDKESDRTSTQPSTRTSSSFDGLEISNATTRSNSVSASTSNWLSPSADATSPASPTGLNISRRSSTTNFAHHHDRPTAQYMAELYHLRRDLLVRLRHAVRRFDAAWREAKRASQLHVASTAARKHGEAAFSADVEHALDYWWAAKKALVDELMQTGAALEHGHDFALGWGSNGGIGWT